jgi:hypothetical protein
MEKRGRNEVGAGWGSRRALSQNVCRGFSNKIAMTSNFLFFILK